MYVQYNLIYICLTRAHEPAVLRSYSWFMNATASELEINVDKSFAQEEPDKEQ